MLASSGCVAYRGFYNQSEAEAFAQELKEQGLDVYVGESSLFDSGLFQRSGAQYLLKSGSAEVARLIFHELAHQLIFVEGDTAFNDPSRRMVETRPAALLEQKGTRKSVASLTIVASKNRFRGTLDQLSKQTARHLCERSAR